MKCKRKYLKCKGETDQTINGKPVCPGCREKGERFDSAEELGKY